MSIQEFAVAPAKHLQSTAAPPESNNQGTKRLRFAMVCASNQNRSMEAHALLQKEGFQVQSFGVGAHVKLPGSSAREPNVYPFGTPYRVIYEDLKRKDPDLYMRNGLLRMLERNLKVKTAPLRWQECREPYDVVVTFEERVMEQVLDDLHARPLSAMRPALVINLDVKDSHEEAALAAPHALELCSLLDKANNSRGGMQGSSEKNGSIAGEEGSCTDACGDDDGPNWCDVEPLLDAFEKRTGRRAVYSICFY
ncbi:RNA polymerase II subunit A [Dunaliella salina]|uniref:RNA polymerase II subunit A C-terminal domain phosphatase SSU72 n=1 Tax=Dunaliella salina TaxID=3046 RepID=A0ABQ7GJG2_DUNSA|nr:RNA polymerase II subunit A [Dunaliella salina]|eukprot:KAF5834753.1 RNA polymerase II subunit A [Dunaliella salina]